MASAIQSPLERLGRRLRTRLSPSTGQRPGRPTDPTWTVQRKLPMSPATLTALEELAARFSSDQRQVSPMQVAALLVEEKAEAFAKSLRQDASAVSES